MATWQIVVAVIAALIGGGLVWWRNSVLKDVRLMLATETTRPERSPASQPERWSNSRAPSAAANRSKRVLQEVLRVAPVGDRGGIPETKPWPRSLQRDQPPEVHNSTRFSKATIDDGSGPVAVNLSSATFEGIEVVNTFDKAGGGLSISLGPLTIGDNTIGHHKREEVVPVGEAIYVLATTAAAGGVGIDPAGRNPFIVRSTPKRNASAKTSTPPSGCSALPSRSSPLEQRSWSSPRSSEQSLRRVVTASDSYPQDYRRQRHARDHRQAGSRSNRAGE